MTGMIFDIREFSIHDGPGARITVFLKGCPLRCRWCHNPEGLLRERQLMVRIARCRQCGKCCIPCGHPECQPFQRCVHACPEGLVEICGKEVEAKALARKLMKSSDILRQNRGGFTLSGGEPLLQAEFVCELLDALDCNTAIETSGYAEEAVFRKVTDKADYVIMDIKLADREAHKRYTGVYNDVILKNLEYLKNSGREYLIRTPLIPGITDREENLDGIRQLIGKSKWEILPYNPMAGVKYPMLGMKYKL